MKALGIIFCIIGVMTIFPLWDAHVITTNFYEENNSKYEMYYILSMVVLVIPIFFFIIGIYLLYPDKNTSTNLQKKGDVKQ